MFVALPELTSIHQLLYLIVLDVDALYCRILLDKKYALPYRVVDAVVFHFLGFR